jgi:AcrR family transcriptional regulator
MGSKERREKEKAALRQEILAAARELFVNEGFESVSMRRIAEKIEYSPTTIYLYFKDKRDLLFYVCEETFGQLGEELDRAREDASDPMDALRKGLRAYIDFGLNNPNHYEVVLMNPIAGYLEDSDHPYEGSLGQAAFEKLRETVKNCMDFGQIRRDDVELVSQTLWAGIHGVTSLLIGHKHFPFASKSRFIKSVIETMIAGMKA